jgi:alkylated DNA repair dioxygenase AlkB
MLTSNSELFPKDDLLPKGFQYVEEFISADEEQKLLHTLQDMQLHTFVFQGFEAKRKVASFGFDYSFDNRQLSKGKEIPDSFIWIINRVANFVKIAPEQIQELLLTEYPVGAVINWHRDAFPFELIAGISLGADCIFKLRPHEKQKQNRKAVISIPLRRRSLYVMEGEARLQWQHSIAPVARTRYSITLRTLYAKRSDTPGSGKLLAS